MLLLRPDHLGDVLLTSPALATLQQALPHARFTYLVGPWAAEVARHGPLGHAVRPLAFPGFARRQGSSPLAPYALLWRQARRLRQERYTAAVVFRPDHWWGALLALAADIPIRVGFDTPETRPLLTHARATRPDQHAADASLDLAETVLALLGGSPHAPSPGPRFTLGPEDHARAEAFWHAHRLGRRPLVVLQPSAGAPLKSWPVARWATVADGLARSGADLLLSGGPDDGPLLAALRAAMAGPPAAEALGLPLGTLAALLARAALALGPDNGILHLAAAVGTPTVRLYGPAPPRVFGPWPPGADQRALLADAARLPCVPCGHLVDPPCAARHTPPCLLAHSADAVLAEARTVLRGRRARRA